MPWPAIGPDVTGGDLPGVSGKAYKIPSQLCYEAASIDADYGSSNVIVFNAKSCYGSAKIKFK